ncbi:Uma2 family endonuclease [Desulfobacterales bacterium HSG16]|nr:Uma2 family endonuclease [Desulfobacterales bacterium HSG16]
MNIAYKIQESAMAPDRPGWIPPDIIADWDTDPYAYQTEEELMPAGGLHGKILTYTTEILRDFLEKQGLMLLVDTFILYRDRQGNKQRTAPDLLLMPFRTHPPNSYDLDVEPPPLCVVEITSPKSHLKDLKSNILFYMGLKIPTYLVMDAVTPQKQIRDQIELHMWRKSSGQVVQPRPDARGCLLIPEMNVRIKTEGQRIVFEDADDGKLLHDAGQFRIEVLNQKQRADTAEKKKEEERQRADTAEKEKEEERQRTDTAEKEKEEERQRAVNAEQRAERLAEKLRSLGIEL